MAAAAKPAPKPAADVPTDFGRHLRACMRCKLLKTFEQFYDRGCENCAKLGMEGDRSRIEECTTTHFNGTISVFQPTTSWSAKWLRLERQVPGCYALSVTDKIPDEVMESLDE